MGNPLGLGRYSHLVRCLLPGRTVTIPLWRDSWSRGGNRICAGSVETAAIPAQVGRHVGVYQEKVRLVNWKFPRSFHRWLWVGCWPEEMPTQIRYQLNTLFLLLLLGGATAADAQVQAELAKRYFEEATKLCERDAGRLWGVSLCGPMVIVDQATGTRATSSRNLRGRHPAFRVSRTVPSSGAGCGGLASPSTCSRRTMPMYASK